VTLEVRATHRDRAAVGIGAPIQDSPRIQRYALSPDRNLHGFGPDQRSRNRIPTWYGWLIEVIGPTVGDRLADRDRNGRQADKPRHRRSHEGAQHDPDA
jgi:hypothetical protein